MSPSFGGTTGTPITGGAGSGAISAQPLPYTLLSLTRFAKVMGITPLHFARGYAHVPENNHVFPDTGCSSMWFKYDWQAYDQVSWMQLAQEIQTVERQIAEIIGYWPAPVWIEEEEHQYPSPYRAEYHGTGHNVRGKPKSIKAEFGKFVTAGRRAVDLIGTATVTGGSLAYTDEDLDGFYETATITLATSLTNPREIKAYFVGADGAQDWEIREPRSVTISGGNVVMVFDSWLLIDPNLYENYPYGSEGTEAINVTTVGNFVNSVEVYREYTDDTQVSSKFYWETSCLACGGLGCAACNGSTQDGCLYVRDSQLGMVVPYPASYDSAEGQWTGASDWTEGYEPDRVKLWYYAGNQDQAFLRNNRLSPLSEFWARLIAELAITRLDRPLCECSNVRERADNLREDLLKVNRDRSFFATADIQNSPFGSKLGEVEAWRKIKYTIKDKVPKHAVLV